MPLTKEQFEDIKALVATREPANIERAKRTLRSIDDDKTRTMLASLEAKYPTPTRERVTSIKKGPAAAPVDDLSEIKSLIAQKKYDEAEALLWESKSLEAADLLRKLTLVRGAQPGTAKAVSVTPTAPVPQKANSSSTSNRPRNLLLFTVACIMAGFVGLFGISAIQQYLNRIPLRLESVCRDMYSDGWIFDKEYTYAQLALGCKYIAIDIMDTQGEEARYCFDAFGETDKRFADCLDEQVVYFYRPYIYQARDNPELLGSPGNFPTPDLR